MSSPATPPTLVWRSALLLSRRVLAAFVVVVVVAGIAVVASLSADGTAASRPNRADVAGCPFEQRWFTGDLHFWQELVFDRDGTGVWESGGMDSDASHDRVSFAWTRDRSTLTVVADSERRTVGYEIHRNEDSDLCFLWLDGRFLPHEHQSTHWSDSDWR